MRDSRPQDSKESPPSIARGDGLSPWGGCKCYPSEAARWGLSVLPSSLATIHEDLVHMDRLGKRYPNANEDFLGSPRATDTK